MLGVCGIAVAYLAMAAGILMAWNLLQVWQPDLAIWDGVSGSVDSVLAEPDRPVAVVILLSSFIGMFLAVIFATLILHRYGWRGLIGPGPALRNGVIAALALMAASGLALNIPTGVGYPIPNQPPEVLLSWIWLALPFLFIQVTAEELIFRGYLMQVLAAKFQSRLIWFVLPSLIFALGHYDPTVDPVISALIITATFIMGLILAEITVRTGNLGAAIGLHFANNFFAMMIVSLDGGISGLSLYKTPFRASDTGIMQTQMVYEIAYLCALFVVFHIVWTIRTRRTA